MTSEYFSCHFSAPWYMRNPNIHRDLDVARVGKEIGKFNQAIQPIVIKLKYHNLLFICCTRQPQYRSGLTTRSIFLNIGSSVSPQMRANNDSMSLTTPSSLVRGEAYLKLLLLYGRQNPLERNSTLRFFLLQHSGTLNDPNGHT